MPSNTVGLGWQVGSIDRKLEVRNRGIDLGRRAYRDSRQVSALSECIGARVEVIIEFLLPNSSWSGTVVTEDASAVAFAFAPSKRI